MRRRTGRESDITQSDIVLEFVRKTGLRDFTVTELATLMHDDGCTLRSDQIRSGVFKLRDVGGRLIMRSDGRDRRYTLVETLAHVHNMPMLTGQRGAA